MVVFSTCVSGDMVQEHGAAPDSIDYIATSAANPYIYDTTQPTPIQPTLT